MSRDAERELLAAYREATKTKPEQLEAGLDALAREAAQAGPGSTGALASKALPLLGAAIGGAALIAYLAWPRPSVESPVEAETHALVEPQPEPEPAALPNTDAPPPQAPPAPEPQADSVEVAPQPASAPVDAKAPSKAEPKPEVAPEPDPLEEIQLIARARRAIKKGDYAKAESLLELHAERFPDGQLAQERESSLGVVRCELDPTSCPPAN